MLTPIIAGIAFIALFGAWVIIPSRLKKYHQSKEEMDK
jgi:hypothetical protein